VNQHHFIRKYGIILFIFMGSLLPLFSHPHMLFENRYILETDADRLEGLWVDWIFDPYFTEEILFDYDEDRNRVFSSAETQNVHDYAFIHLTKYNYFQLIRKGDKRLKIESIENFQVFVEADSLVYRFFIPLENEFSEAPLWLASYDPTFFCAIQYSEEKAVTFSVEDTDGWSYAMEENPEFPIYYDPMGAPSESPIFEEWKPGLRTHIPIEVHLEYK